MADRRITMKKRLAVVICIILVSMLPSLGCVRVLHHDSSYTPALAGDGAGGAIVVYEKPQKGSLIGFYAQRISPEGKHLWGVEGVLLGSGYKEISTFRDFKIVNDTQRGVFIAWEARYPESATSVDRIAMVNAEGAILWQKEVPPFNLLADDGTGGDIVVFDRAVGPYVTGYDEGSFVIMKLDAQGSYTWGEWGITIPRIRYWPNSLRVIGYGGGAIAIWEELESRGAGITSRILAQRIDAEGNFPWGSVPIQVYTNAEGVRAEEVDVIGDGEGGVIIAWQQNPEGKVIGGTPEWLTRDICVQRVNADGDIMWPSEGVALGITRAAELAGPHSPNVCSDGSQGAVIMWEDLRNGLASIYAQRVDASGTPAWQPGGVEVCYIKSPASLTFRQITGNGDGGATISCGFLGGVLIQKLDSSGNALWTSNGVVVTTSSTTSHMLSSDGQGGGLIAWGVGGRSYVQRIGPDGGLLWGEESIRLDASGK
jgi:hypothetical protein